jgi:HTH-type transcriptional regulator / antitoxin HigA
MSAVMNVGNERIYRQLVSKILPHVIHTERENQHYITELEALHDRGKLTTEEEQLAELLTLLIEDFEHKRYPLRTAGPLDVVRELMAANGLKQADLLDLFGTPSVASEVMKGKRKLSKAHISRLSERFHVSPEVFFSSALTGTRKARKSLKRVPT